MRRQRKQAGFTLIELMVSLVLFSFAIAGVLAIAVSMAQGYREQRQIVATEGAARGALDYITDALRMASPAVENGQVTDSQLAPGVGTPHLTIGNISDTLGPGAGACPRGAVKVYNNVGAGNTDILEVVFAAGGVVTSIGATAWAPGDATLNVVDSSNISDGDTLILANGDDGHLVRVSSVASATSVNLVAGTCAVTPPAVAYGQGTLVVRALRARFYVGAFDGISPVLLMDPDGDGPSGVEPLADYVEDFQVAAGVDEDASGSIDAGEWGFSAAGVPAAAYTLNDATRLLHAIRVTIVARAAGSLVATTATYKRPAVEDHPIAATFDTFRRRTIRATIDIRNLGGSPE